MKLCDNFPHPGRIAYCSVPNSPPPGRIAYCSAPNSPPPGRIAYCSAPNSPPPGRMAYCSAPNSPPHGRIAYCSSPNSRPPATKALHTICGNNTDIVSSSWWWAYKCPKHVEQIVNSINHSVASSCFSSLRSCTFLWQFLSAYESLVKQEFPKMLLAKVITRRHSGYRWEEFVLASLCSCQLECDRK